jgi:hypothetical protein
LLLAPAFERETIERHLSYYWSNEVLCEFKVFKLVVRHYQDYVQIKVSKQNKASDKECFYAAVRRIDIDYCALGELPREEVDV